MAIFEITADAIRTIEETTFGAAGVRERADLQRLLRKQIEIISPDTLIVAEEFSEWEDSKRRIDLLGIDRNANLVVIELKRTEDGGHMELQAIRYAAMVSTMTFDKVVEVYTNFLQSIGTNLDAQASLLGFFGWEEPQEEQFAQDVHIVLASAEFSTELTTAVLWLNKRDLDIRCVRIKPYKDSDRLLIDVQQVIPLPEASEFIIGIKNKEQKGRQTHGAYGEKYWVDNYPETLNCANWYRDLLTRYYKDVPIKYGSLITIYVGDLVRVAIWPRKGGRALTSVEKYEGDFGEAVKHLTNEGIPVVPKNNNKALTFTLDFQELKEKQAAHEWIAERLVPSLRLPVPA